MALRLADGTAWTERCARAVAAAPEAFDADRTPAQPGRGRLARRRHARAVRTPVDNTVLVHLPRLDADAAAAAVALAAAEHRAWAATPLAERKARVTAALDALTAHRDLLALLLVWEIGKPWRLACADVDRALDGVRWYVERDRPA